MHGMISRVTIFSLLFALMLGLGIYMHTQAEIDRCTTYPAGGAPPRSEYVVTGSHEVEVPCNEWFLRQSQTVQVLCLLDAVLATLFVIRAVGDLCRWIAWRRNRKSVKVAAVQ